MPSIGGHAMDERATQADQTERRQSDLLLSHVDLVTNGFAGLLLLFFLFAAVQRELLWLTEDSGQAAAAPRRDPLVVLVSAGPGDLLPAGAESPWVLPPGYTAEHSHGREYAVLYSAAPPADGQAVGLRGLKPGSEVDIQVTALGKEPTRMHVLVLPDGTLPIWPLAAAPEGQP